MPVVIRRKYTTAMNSQYVYHRLASHYYIRLYFDLKLLLLFFIPQAENAFAIEKGYS